MAKSEEQAVKNATEGQPLVNAWHQRMAELDAKAPKVRRMEDDDPKRGCLSPLGGMVW